MHGAQVSARQAFRPPAARCGTGLRYHVWTALRRRRWCLLFWRWRRWLWHRLVMRQRRPGKRTEAAQALQRRKDEEGSELNDEVDDDDDDDEEEEEEEEEEVEDEGDDEEEEK